jgi:hypothetical protein
MTEEGKRADFVEFAYIDPSMLSTKGWLNAQLLYGTGRPPAPLSK